jgi:uncharacterized protein YegL/Flp pilus assembly protein TadG
LQHVGIDARLVRALHFDPSTSLEGRARTSLVEGELTMKKFTKNRRQRKGAMLVLIAVTLVVFIAMTVFAIDIALMHLVRTELRTSTDAAARAASEALIRTQSVAEARAAARNAASRNQVFNEPLQLADSDIVFGTAEASGNGLFTFSPGGNQPNAVRVNGRRTAGSPSGTVPLFLGGILGTPFFEPELASTSTGFVRDIGLVLDRSGSMSGQKIADLKSAVSAFLAIMNATPSDERVSLASYSTTGTKDVDMTSDLALVSQEVNRFQASGFTAIGQGLQLGINSLNNDANSRPFAEKTIILMTDGRENRNPPVETIVPQAVAQGITIHTITFGAGADQPLMRRVASATGGTHQFAATGADLEEAFREIARTLAVVLID